VLIGYVGGLLLTELITHVHIGPLGKFVGIVAILALAIMYAEIGAFQKVARPVLKIFVPLMRLVDFIVGGVFQLIFWTFKKAWSLVRR
jgi:ABC-type phosphate/phosphonate transport system permease subunit